MPVVRAEMMAQAIRAAIAAAAPGDVVLLSPLAPVSTSSAISRHAAIPSASWSRC
jgi:dTDP-4-amino-4,6-dideoxygalactose transaminase